MLASSQMHPIWSCKKLAPCCRRRWQRPSRLKWQLRWQKPPRGRCSYISPTPALLDAKGLAGADVVLLLMLRVHNPTCLDCLDQRDHGPWCVFAAGAAQY